VVLQRPRVHGEAVAIGEIGETIEQPELTLKANVEWRPPAVEASLSTRASRIRATSPRRRPTASSWGGC
jgi:hypothetical protein